MLRSMTGFGKATAEIAGRKVSVEIRTLNSKQLDINTRIASLYREKEGEIRSEISRQLERGKIDVNVYFENNTDASEFSISRDLVKKYHNEIVALSTELGINPGNEVLSLIFSMPEVLKSDKTVLVESEWLEVKKVVLEALALTDAFRINEGALMGNDMRSHIKTIVSLLDEVEPLEKMRIVNLRERFKRNLADFFETATKSEKFDENRFEQEIFWYIEKLDITEEKVRLAKHCDYFIDAMQSDESVGRKLNFITQEIGREINTLGSKAADAGIQKIVVQMKDELEKIKEQVSNIL